MKEIRKIIKEVLEEELLNEIEISSIEPVPYEKFQLNGEVQYGFKTKNNNTYYLSLKDTKVNINNQDVLKLCKDDINEDGTIDFVAINFFPDDKNPNDSSAYSILTNRNEQFTVLSNIVWLIINHDSNKKRFISAAEPRRMKLYENAFKSFESDFIVFMPDMYDISYQDKQFLLIRK